MITTKITETDPRPDRVSVNSVCSVANAFVRELLEASFAETSAAAPFCLAITFEQK